MDNNNRHGRPPMQEEKEKKDFGKMGMTGGPPGRNMGMPVVKPKNAKAIIGRLWQYLSANKILLILAFICVIINASFTLIASYTVRPIINNIAYGGENSQLMQYILFMFVVYMIAIICSYLQSRLMLEIAQKSLKKIRDDLFASLQKLPLKYFDTHGNGDLMSRFTNDVDTVSQMLSETSVQIISGAVTLVSTFSIMVYTNWQLTIVTLLIAPILMTVTKLIAGKSRGYYKEQQKSLGALNAYIEEGISGQKVIKVFNHEQKTIDEFEELNNQYRKKSFSANFIGGIMGPIMGSIGNLSYSLTAGVGGLFCVLNGFDVGGLTIFINYAKSFTKPISDISMQMNTIFSALAGAERVFEMMDVDPEDEDKLNAIFDVTIKGEVELKNVNFEYIPNSPVLKNVTLKAHHGQKIAFVGSTGAGKTTITNLLNRFYDISDGEILIDGININDYKRDFLRKNIAMVLQDTHLFTGTVRENILYGRLDATEEDIISAAKTANAHGFIKRLENGYDTILTGDGSNLSQGQRQLLNIARAAISKAPILVLDEATSSVDTRTERHIEQALDRLMKTRTTFVIAHRLSTVRNSDVIMVLEHGEIIESGNHDELMAKNGKYYSLYTGNSQLE